MFSIKYGDRQNLLKIELHSHFDALQGRLLCERLEKELKKTKKDFIVFSVFATNTASPESTALRRIEAEIWGLI